MPGDVAITGFDDVPMAALVAPSLTTVRQPIRELAATAARMLRQAVAGDPMPIAPIVLPTRLVVASSCGCRADASERITGRMQSGPAPP